MALVVSHDKLAEVVGYKTLVGVICTVDNLFGVEDGLIARLRTIDAIEILGDVHCGSLCHLKDRLSTHKDMAGSSCLEILGDYTTVGVHLEAVLIGIAEVNLEQLLHCEFTVVDDIAAACGIVEIVSSILTVIDPRVIIAVNVGIAADSHRAIILYVAAASCMQTGGSHSTIVDNDRIAVLCR